MVDDDDAFFFFVLGFDFVFFFGFAPFFFVSSVGGDVSDPSSGSAKAGDSINLKAGFNDDSVSVEVSGGSDS